MIPRAIHDLGCLSDIPLFKELSVGLPLIVENAVSLDDAARLLYRDKAFRASKVMRGFAEEEAAKFFILIDFVRCPRESKKRNRILKYFYDHVAKRIYAVICSYPNTNIRSFGEFSELVKNECRPYGLVGPNYVDWIIPSSISADRERSIYVDYVRDITDEDGQCLWVSPIDREPFSTEYNTPDCIRLIRALTESKAGSPDGLAQIADIWRGFKPVCKTLRIPTIF